MYASFLRISRALHQDVFDQPAGKLLFNNLPAIAESFAALMRLQMAGGLPYT
jgi:fumarate reductase subunit D